MTEQVFLHHSEYPDLQITFTPLEIQEIRNSWNSMKDDPSTQEKATVHGTASAFFCQQFYENLLGEYPELKVLFPSIKGQASSMAGILSLVISQLDNLSRVNDILTSLGKRHSRIIGVEVVHFELVGNALLRTLQDRCGDNFTIELENAWIKLYSYIANLMLQAGEDPPVPQQALYPVLTPTSSIVSDNSRTANSNNNTNSPVTGNNNSNNPQLSHPVTQAPISRGGNINPTVNTAAATATKSLPPQPSAGSNVGKGYDPSRSHFKAKGGKKKKGKNADCVVM